MDDGEWRQRCHLFSWQHWKISSNEAQILFSFNFQLFYVNDRGCLLFAEFVSKQATSKEALWSNRGVWAALLPKYQNWENRCEFLLMFGAAQLFLVVRKLWIVFETLPPFPSALGGFEDKVVSMIVMLHSDYNHKICLEILFSNNFWNLHGVEYKLISVIAMLYSDYNKKNC